MVSRTQKVIDILQWVMIVGLALMLLIQQSYYIKNRDKLTASEEYNKESTYVRIHESRAVEELKKENKILYDSIKNLNNVEAAMIVKYTTRYSTDTVYVEKFVTVADTTTVVVDDVLIAKVDSAFEYTEDNDTVNLRIKVKANELEWVKADFALHDQFMIINREKDGINQSIIHHSDYTTIDETTMWHKKEAKKWYQKFVLSPQVGVGYGVINKKADLYVGVGVGYSF